MTVVWKILQFILGTGIVNKWLDNRGKCEHAKPKGTCDKCGGDSVETSSSQP